jgi:S-adenosylmethionine:tRNA ribosyltransferase-isomerase
MRTSDFDYELPPELIAKEPARPRDASRMLVLDRETGRWIDSEFRRLPEILKPSDVLVFNDTRVIRARIVARLNRVNGSSRNVEVLFASPANEGAWEVLCRPGKRIREGDRLIFAEGELEGVIGETRGHGLRLIHVDASVEEFLEGHGHVPLPPYINRDEVPSDVIEYQTVYAKAPGAIAAPTAGLHFTDTIFRALRSKGIEIVMITLHVGIGTFIPVRTPNPSKHVLKPERFGIGEETASLLNVARSEGRRIVAVGTTTTRTLEYVFGRHGKFVAESGDADILILPGYEFKAVSGLLTNFHLPQSTLVMLVSAFASRDKILAAYHHAIELRYRFYSYGDCMLIT